MTQPRRIILASQSPRRKQLLTAMGVEFETIPSGFDEYLDDARDPGLIAKELALGKALDVAKKFPDAYVIGSDSIVTIDGHQLEKPTSLEDALEMLKQLAGKPNYATTGVAVVCIDENVRLTDAATSAVFFNDYDEAAVRKYVATGDPMDKAGGYGMQHPLCKPLIKKVDGAPDNVIGFPTKSIASLLETCGIKARALEPNEVLELTSA